MHATGEQASPPAEPSLSNHVPATVPVEHCQQAPTTRHSLCFTRGMAARLLLLVGIAAAVIGLFGTVLYLFQPWRTCPYDDSPAACAMLPGDAMVMAAAFALLCVGVATAVIALIVRTRTQGRSSV